MAAVTMSNDIPAHWLVDKEAVHARVVGRAKCKKAIGSYTVRSFFPLPSLSSPSSPPIPSSLPLLPLLPTSSRSSLLLPQPIANFYSPHPHSHMGRCRCTR